MSLSNSEKRKINILIVDDEPLVRRSLSEFLTLEGYTVTAASNGIEAMELLKNYSADMVISDIKMPEMTGIELLKHIRKTNFNAPVILITGYGSIENAVEGIKEGAYDYITKPIIDSEIKLVIERLAREKQLIKENIELKEQLSVSSRERFLSIVGKESKMQKIYSLIEAIASTRATVLINGESGTGKHLIAHAIHEYDLNKRGRPFVEVSCGALTETLLESELFGHIKGAFTGAIRDKSGRFELANGGTIFLDEIDAFSPALQVKLLRVIQEGELERVGDSKTITVDVRIIASTNQNLQELIAQGKFRQDLYYRLNIINIEVPPLRERKSDLKILANDLLEKHARKLGKRIEGFSEEVLLKFMNYNWPGNVRELENIIERAIILTKGTVIGLEDLPDFFNVSNENGKEELVSVVEEGSNGGNGRKLKDALKDPERDLILRALESSEWNRNDAAKNLGINRTTLYKKMVKFELLKTNGRKR